MSYFIDIEKATIDNTDYRRVLYTPGNLQLVLMSIPVGQDIPLEVHPDIDQFIRFEAGEGEVRLGKNQDRVYKVKDGSSITIQKGVYHRVVNTSLKEPLKLYSIYSPPEHRDQLVQKFKPTENIISKKDIISYFLL
jgi:mannose-6-phosphate isomerase-like protein (cupin superfamily)